MCDQKSLQVCNFRESEVEDIGGKNHQRKTLLELVLCRWNYKLEHPLMKEGLRGNHTVYSVLDLGVFSFTFERLRILG